MMITDVQLKADQLAHAFAKIKSDKNYWKTTAKPLLINTLVKVREVAAASFTIDDSTNEVVGLSIGLNENEPLGLLIFTLTYDGHITIYVRYGTVEYAPTTKTTHYDRLATIETTSLDEAIIYELVYKFLDKMADGYITKTNSSDWHDSY